MKVVGEVRSDETTLKGTKLSALRRPLGFLPKGLPMSVVALKSAAARMAIVRMANGRLRRGFSSRGVGLSVSSLSVVLVKPRVEPHSRIKVHDILRVSLLYRGIDVLLHVDSWQVPCLMPSCRDCGRTCVSDIAGALAPTRPDGRRVAINVVSFRLAILQGKGWIVGASAKECTSCGLVDRPQSMRRFQSCRF